jgi:hypothetical protein
MTDHIERGAQEEQSGAPLTDAEVAASRRPPSQPDSDIEPGADGSELEQGSADVPGAGPADRQLEDPE